jgi:hypothetical protein
MTFGAISPIILKLAAVPALRFSNKFGVIMREVEIKSLCTMPVSRCRATTFISIAVIKKHKAFVAVTPAGLLECASVIERGFVGVVISKTVVVVGVSLMPAACRAVAR